MHFVLLLLLLCVCCDLLLVFPFLFSRISPWEFSTCSSVSWGSYRFACHLLLVCCLFVFFYICFLPRLLHALLMRASICRFAVVVFALFVRRVALCKYLLPPFLGRRKIRLFVAYFRGRSVNAFICCLLFSGQRNVFLFIAYFRARIINAFIRCILL